MTNKFVLVVAVVTAFLILLSPVYTKEKYISAARVKQIVEQEKRYCPRCNEKELLKRINARLARE